jgi:glyoxylase-like metal-dependent hydrolase (beta-lactamase superfamily II)
MSQGEPMRVLLSYVLLYFALLGSVCATAGDSDQFIETRLNERVLLMHHAPWSETMTVVDAGPSLIVVDTWGSLQAAEKAKARIEAIFEKPVSHVIDTHHHWDHTFGNQAFKCATIVGHRFCAGDMRASYGNPAIRKSKLKESASLADNDAIRRYILEAEAESAGDGFRLCPPDREAGDRDALSVGDLTVLLYHTPGIHTRSNVTVFIPELGIAFGRREFAGHGPITFEPGADPVTIARVLEEILASGKPIHYLIPGHGEAVVDPDLKAAAKRLNGRDSK